MDVSQEESIKHELKELHPSPHHSDNRVIYGCKQTYSIDQHLFILS